MVCLISLGKIDKQHIIIPIIALILLIVQNYFVYNSTKFDFIGKHQFIKLIAMSFGKTLAIIPFLLFKKNIRYSDEVHSVSKNRYIYKKEYFENYLEKMEQIKKKKYYIIFLSMILSFSFNILLCHLAYIGDKKFFSFWIFDIFYVWALSYCLLNTKLYRHQIFSLIIITILGITINIVNRKNKPFELVNLIITLSADILFSLNLVINKYLMENLLFSEYEISFYEGFFSLIIFIICLVIFTNIEIKKGIVEYNGKKYIDNFFDYYEKLNSQEIVVLILIVISQLIGYLFSLMTMKYYTVFHIFILLIANEVDFYSYPSKEKYLYYINIILYFLFLFMILVFSENIELNCFGLEKYTKRNISKRAKKEYLKNAENYDSLFGNNISSSETQNERTINGNPNEKSKVEIDRYSFDFPSDEIPKV